MPERAGEKSAQADAAQELFALITGASGGIGACFARALAERGRNLVLAARSGSKLEALKTELSALHQGQAIRIEIVEIDLSVPEAAERLFTALQERGINVSLLVNNAGFGAHGEFVELPLARQSEMLRLNIVTLTELTRLLLPGMVARRSGGIINVSSTASFQPIPYTCVYAATKAYVTSFSMGLAEEASLYGVKVLALCPGGTATNFFDASQFQKINLPGGLQSPEDVVKAALRALDKGKSLAVTRWINRVMIFVQRLAPRRLVARQAGEMFRPRAKSNQP